MLDPETWAIKGAMLNRGVMFTAMVDGELISYRCNSRGKLTKVNGALRGPVAGERRGPYGPRPAFAERNRRICELRERGVPVSQIARTMGLSGERVRQILKMGQVGACRCRRFKEDRKGQDAEAQ